MEFFLNIIPWNQKNKSNDIKFNLIINIDDKVSKAFSKYIIIKNLEANSDLSLSNFSRNISNERLELNESRTA